MRRSTARPQAAPQISRPCNQISRPCNQISRPCNSSSARRHCRPLCWRACARPSTRSRLPVSPQAHAHRFPTRSTTTPRQTRRPAGRAACCRRRSTRSWGFGSAGWAGSHRQRTGSCVCSPSAEALCPRAATMQSGSSQSFEPSISHTCRSATRWQSRSSGCGCSRRAPARAPPRATPHASALWHGSRHAAPTTCRYVSTSRRSTRRGSLLEP